MIKKNIIITSGVCVQKCFKDFDTDLLIINTLTHGITDETTRLVGVGAARKGVQEIGQARGHIVIVLRRHYDVSVGLFHELFVFD